MSHALIQTCSVAYHLKREFMLIDALHLSDFNLMSIIDWELTRLLNRWCRHLYHSHLYGIIVTAWRVRRAGASEVTIMILHANDHTFTLFVSLYIARFILKYFILTVMV